MFEKIGEMIVSGVIGNYSYDRLRRLLKAEGDEGNTPGAGEKEKQEPRDPDIRVIHGQNIEYIKRYRTFDVQNEFDDVVELLSNPLIYIVIEDEPSTAWRLPVIIAEDQTTEEWYVFSKGRIAFEGTGGGLSQAKSFLRKVINKNIPFSAWVLGQAMTEKLSQGCRPWTEVKAKCIPALSAVQGTYFREYVLESLQEIVEVQQGSSADARASRG